VPPEDVASGVARVSAPVESKLEVAFPPKYALSKTENLVEEALRICKRFVEELKVKFALPAKVFPSLNCTCVSLPPGVPEPPLPVMQTLSTAKQPSERLTPPTKVDVPVLVTEKEVAETLVPEIEPPVIVESISAISSS